MSDFSSYVTIRTSASVPTLSFVSSDDPNGLGSYIVAPPQTIDPGSTAAFQLGAASGPYGSDGQVTYTGTEIRLTFAYSCPYGDDPNTGTAQITASDYVVDVWGKSGDGQWQPAGPPGSDHPTYVWFGVRKPDETLPNPLQS